MRTEKFLATRAVEFTLTIFFVLTVTFIVSHLIPSDPARALAGAFASQQAVDSIRHQYGLDQPLTTQFVDYLASVIQGNLGISIVTRRPVIADIEQYLPASIELVVTAFLIAITFGIMLGVVAATRKGRGSGLLASIGALAGYSLPVFWVGMIFQIIFGYYLHVLPIGGRIGADVNLRTLTGFDIIDSIITGNLPALEASTSHLLMPAIVLSFAELGIIAKFVRSTMLDVMSQDYIRTSRAYGFSERRILYKYALRNTLIPVVTHIGLDFGATFGYTVVVEEVFQYAGIGLYLTNAVISLDFPAIMGSVIILASIVVVTNFTIDILYSFLDPRIKRDVRGEE